MKNSILSFVLAISVAGFVSTQPVSAASYASLEKKGYAIGKMTKNKAGKLGWFMKKDDVRYFCKSKVSLALVGSNGLVSISTSGRQISLDRKTFEKTSSLKGVPKLSDLKAGRVTKRDIGRCSKQR